MDMKLGILIRSTYGTALKNWSWHPVPELRGNAVFNFGCLWGSDELSGSDQEVELSEADCNPAFLYVIRGLENSEIDFISSDNGATNSSFSDNHH